MIRFDLDDYLETSGGKLLEGIHQAIISITLDTYGFREGFHGSDHTPCCCAKLSIILLGLNALFTTCWISNQSMQPVSEQATN